MAKSSFARGQDWAYLAGTIAIVLGAALVLLRYSNHTDEQRLLRGFQATDDAPTS